MTKKKEEIPFTPWYMDPACLAELWRWLDDRGEAPKNVAYFLDHPWHWQPDWDALQGDSEWEQR